MMYEEKLSQQEEEHETEIAELNESYMKKIAQLTEMIDNLQKKLDENKRFRDDADTQKNMAVNACDRAKNELTRQKNYSDEKEMQIKLLQ